MTELINVLRLFVWLKVSLKKENMVLIKHVISHWKWNYDFPKLGRGGECDITFVDKKN